MHLTLLAVIAPAVRPRPRTVISIPVAPPRTWAIRAITWAPPIAPPGANPMAAAIKVADPANRLDAASRIRRQGARQIKAARRQG